LIKIVFDKYVIQVTNTILKQLIETTSKVRRKNRTKSNSEESWLNIHCRRIGPMVLQI